MGEEIEANGYAQEVGGFDEGAELLLGPETGMRIDDLRRCRWGVLR